MWKGFEDIKNAPDDTDPVHVEDQIKLTEQKVLLLGQASHSILHSRRLQILKTLKKDTKKPKVCSRKKKIYSKNAIKIFLAKCLDRMLLKQNAPRKEHWRYILEETVDHLIIKSPTWQTKFWYA